LSLNNDKLLGKGGGPNDMWRKRGTDDPLGIPKPFVNPTDDSPNADDGRLLVVIGTIVLAVVVTVSSDGPTGES
jgi:hypothetical protein